MKRVCATLLLLLSFRACPSQQTTRAALFPLYRMDASCVCIKTKKQTPSLQASEITVGGDIFQVFQSRSGSAQEQFRIKIGMAGDKWWNYGIVDEADFNGDDVPDYSWYGGDDTGFAMNLFLSTGARYKQVDVLKTVQASWQRRFHQPPPDLGDAGGAYGIRHLELERSPQGLVLLVSVTREESDTNSNQSYRFRIAEKDFRR